MLRSTHKDQLFFTVANNQNKTLNIVKMLLENYGYRVVDLGRDVDPHEIVRVAKEQNIRLIGLSALMTTTVKAMEQTIDLLREEIPDAKTFVGGAVCPGVFAFAVFHVVCVAAGVGGAVDPGVGAGAVLFAVN